VFKFLGILLKGISGTVNRQSNCTYQNGTNYSGFNLGALPVTSQQDCCNQCGANPSCQAFAFFAPYSYCFMKFAVPNTPKETLSSVNFGFIQTR
jgi:hypothetical protein